MPEDVLFKSENVQSRKEIASYLRQVADKLDEGNPITLKSGADTLMLEPSSNPTFEVKAEREGPNDGPNELSIEFELEWDEATADSDKERDLLEIE